MAYLCGKTKTYPCFYYRFNVDEEGRLANLFWTDSTSHIDYACFGDVLAFDTTYQTNAYKKPLVILVGVNHHHQIVDFGCALLMDESIATYEWVLQTFLLAMMDKKPFSVVTDGDKAMRKEIKKFFPMHAIACVHVHEMESRRIWTCLAWYGGKNGTSYKSMGHGDLWQTKKVG